MKEESREEKREDERQEKRQDEEREREMKEKLIFCLKNVSGPSNPPDELAKNVSKKILFGRITPPFFFESSESDRVFNYLHASNSIFRAGRINSEIFFGGTVLSGQALAGFSANGLAVFLWRLCPKQATAPETHWIILEALQNYPCAPSRTICHPNGWNRACFLQLLCSKSKPE